MQRKRNTAMLAGAALLSLTLFAGCQGSQEVTLDQGYRGQFAGILSERVVESERSEESEKLVICDYATGQMTALETSAPLDQILTLTVNASGDRLAYTRHGFGRQEYYQVNYYVTIEDLDRGVVTVLEETDDKNFVNIDYPLFIEDGEKLIYIRSEHIEELGPDFINNGGLVELVLYDVETGEKQVLDSAPAVVTEELDGTPAELEFYEFSKVAYDEKAEQIYYIKTSMREQIIENGGMKEFHANSIWRHNLQTGSTELFYSPEGSDYISHIDVHPTGESLLMSVRRDLVGDFCIGELAVEEGRQPSLTILLEPDETMKARYSAVYLPDGRISFMGVAADAEEDVYDYTRYVYDPDTGAAEKVEFAYDEEQYILNFLSRIY